MQGESRTNGYRCVITKDGLKGAEFSKRLGIGTNNIAEWKALIEGLKFAKVFKCKKLQVCGDSQLVIKQIKGQYKVKSKNLIPLFNEAKKLCNNFKEIDFKWVNREDNARADTLSNKALDEKV